ncbi:MAG: hypothetical protein ABWZ82_10995 [Candidatus Limnocylindrales bacterium]
MNDGYMWWLVLVGLGVGVALTWLSVVRLPRHEYDVDAVEREEEAALIAWTIESRGGVCPAPLAHEVLDLHQDYLATPGLAAPVLAAVAPEARPGEA